MSEIPFFFTKHDQRLFSILHKPDGEQKKQAWVFCHPFAEEKLWSHRVFVSMARTLSDMGYPVLRFDYRGYGDSDGDFDSVTLDDQLDDINSAIDVLFNKVPDIDSVCLLGLRYGALLAAITAENNKKVSHLVMWDPVMDMGSYLQDVLRANLTTQMVMHGKVVKARDELIQDIMNDDVVNVDGYDLTRKFYAPAKDVNLLNMDKSFSGKCQIVQIGRRNQKLKKDISLLGDLYKQSDIEQVEEEQFWKEIKNYVQLSKNLSDSLIIWMGNNLDD